MRLKRTRDSEITYTMQDLLVLPEYKGGCTSDSAGGEGGGGGRGSGCCTSDNNDSVSSRTIAASRIRPSGKGVTRDNKSDTTCTTTTSNSTKLSYSRGRVISNICSWWWLYCCCYLCLLSNYASFAVNGAYPDTDELINELDRPSK